ETILNLDLDGNMLIEASAGTGKTYTITDLYLRHILQGRLAGEILVVTYTNAATEELQGRVRKRLRQALGVLQQSLSADDVFLGLLLEQHLSFDEGRQQLQIKRLQLALRSMDEACISTIHGFCQRSLQQHALGGNQFFDSELMENDDLLWQQALQDWWRTRIYPLDSDQWALIKGNLLDLAELKFQLQEIRNKPHIQLIPNGPFDLSNMKQNFQSIAESAKALAPQWQQHRELLKNIIFTSSALSRSGKSPYHPDKLNELFEKADAFFNAPDSSSMFEEFIYLGSESLHENSKPSKKGQDNDLTHTFFEQCSVVAKQLSGLKSGIQPMLLIDAYQYASKRVVELKAAIPALSFHDLLDAMHSALTSDNGHQFCEQLQAQYPVAMIDEFQDTDSLQYQIFNQIYGTAKNTSFTMIGDPKQAIYSFRGGDIFTYLQAKEQNNLRHFNLLTNWRSQPQLVEAVNHLFYRHTSPFIYSAIPFETALPRPENNRLRLAQSSISKAPFVLWQLPQNDGQYYSREQMRDLINQGVASEIKSLLSKENPATIDNRQIQSGDIAILVRQANEGQALARVLQSEGIACITIGRENVFDSAEANGLYQLLVAVAGYEDPLTARRSLASSLLKLDYPAIAHIVDDDLEWQNWLDQLTELNRVWQHRGFIPMFQLLLYQLDLTAQLANPGDGERRITNLLHLADLLQRQSVSLSGISALLTWFKQQFDQPVNDSAELRLESDTALVKIVTIHKSKGLQYPIVFAPFLWSCRPVRKQGPIYFHDQLMQPVLDIGSDHRAKNWLIAEQERLAEDIRLLYVAVTRAQSRIYLAWGEAGNPGKPGYSKETALAYLLHSRQKPADLGKCPIDGFPADMDFASDIQEFVDSSEGNIFAEPLPTASDEIYTGASNRVADCSPKVFDRLFGRPWRINSFSGLTRHVHQTALRGSRQIPVDPVLAFPAGSHVGLLIHSLLEHLDFTGDIAEQCKILLPEFLPASGISSEGDQKTLILWLERILHAELDAEGLTLKQLPNGKRLNELSFDFSLNCLDPERLNSLLQSFTHYPLQPVGGNEFGGLITGVIDLVFESNGRFYLADYKSNYLGASFDDYHPEQLLPAIYDRRYDLQSFIYCLALHRYLQTRLPDYQYESHFGGSYYLFLRGMRPQQDKPYGIHFERPGEHQINELDQLFEYSSMDPEFA
ncbi:MAG: exodeoxyribonuclease V subunit beta, partial [Pseudomonadota bacterium]